MTREKSPPDIWFFRSLGSRHLTCEAQPPLCGIRSRGIVCFWTCTWRCVGGKVLIHNATDI